MKKNSMPFPWAHHERRSNYVTDKLNESGLEMGKVEGFVDKTTLHEGSTFHDERVGVAIDDTSWDIGK